jgi:hypothetical protein
MKRRLIQLASMLVLLVALAAVPRPCVAVVGDCSGDGVVTIDELTLMVGIALGSTPVSACPPGDANGDGQITIDEVIIAVGLALNAPSSTSTPTRTATPNLPTPTATAAPTVVAPPTLLPSSTGLYVGTAKRDITPPSPVYLGGYGFGGSRKSNGVLAPIYVRAFVISDGTHTVVFADNETQGSFAAYKKGPWGHTDSRKTVEFVTAGLIPADHIVINSCHSHAGPDTSGVFGGLPNSYLAYIKDQTVGAIIDAWQAMRPAQLLVGAVNAGEYLHSQFSEPPNDQVDQELRVLVAADPADPTKVQGVMINYAAHATIMGSDNLKVSSDWPGVAATKVEHALGIETAVVMVADVGRTQPNGEEGADQYQELDDYASKITAKILAAVGATEPVSGTDIAANQLFIREGYNNRFIDSAILLGAVSRSGKPPWTDDTTVPTTVGTVVSTLQVGDLFFAAMPGEGYPEIFFELQQRVQAHKRFIFGLANDQLGYLIAPQEGYEQVAAKAPIDNDNALFNLSPLIGDHVMCKLFQASRNIGYTLPADPEKCAAWATEDNTLPY